ncbi:hypothetical protein BPAE_0157g00060 [Botrytis paeoniae]|uniref:Uncharacterized protein n=1 Tax=Botrytis paeoniae TaxID=278948 RepID=A0A4Z1FHH8_9HELO|nr:hypothetical protein BPAE_0157g00060 [Botrytis paeoniae]
MLDYNADIDVAVDMSCDIGLVPAVGGMWKMGVSSHESTARLSFRRCGGSDRKTEIRAVSLASRIRLFETPSVNEALQTFTAITTALILRKRQTLKIITGTMLSFFSVAEALVSAT